MVIVYSWRRLADSWGHASMYVGPSSRKGLYISWWPKGYDRDPQDARYPKSPFGGLRFGDLVAPAEYHTSLGADEALEGRPHHTCRIDGLQEQEIWKWWVKWLSAPQFYCALDRNCSTTVGKALHEGDKRTRYAEAGGWREGRRIVTSADVALYAAMIYRGSRKLQRFGMPRRRH